MTVATGTPGPKETPPDSSADRVAQGDWLDLAPSLAPDSIDLLYVDPPFNTGQPQRADAGAFDDRWPDLQSYLAWFDHRLDATLPALKRSASLLIHLDWRTSHRVRVLLDERLGHDRFVNHLIWRYGLGGSSARRFARKHDDILFYCIDPNEYWFDAPRVPATSNRMRGMLKKATDVLDVPSINNMASERVGWPTQKPLALLEMLIGACCPPGGTVLDPCCGSGTTLVAARRLNRAAIGFDANPDAVTLTKRRLNAQTPHAGNDKT